MAPVRDVWLWPADEVLPENEWGGDTPYHVTDVFPRRSKPKRGSILLGLGIRGFPDERDAIFVVGVVDSSQPVATNKDRLRVSPMMTLPDLPLQQVLNGGQFIANGNLADLTGRPWGSSTPPTVEEAYRLDPARAQASLDAIARMFPDFTGFLRRIESSRQVTTGASGARMREERDAIVLAADFANMEIPDGLLTADPNSGRPLSSLIDPSFVANSEDDLLAEDTRRFDSFGTVQLQSSAVATFTDHNFRLTIMNVNRKPLEHVLGVDLVYVDEIRKSFTLVQYKRLTRHIPPRSDPSAEKWKYTRRDELIKQLNLMKLKESKGGGGQARDWRMVQTPFWFKFVREDAFCPGDKNVLKGMYVPADYLQLAIEDDTLRSGPSGGFEVTYANTQYITRSTFVDLTRRGMLGSNTSQSADILSVIEGLARNRQVIVSIKERNQ